ncbi:DUF2199 domain-containing protein [Pedobacter gandavensis]|uniref:DUF2199 domain-containing protein n=1 Tax=Pedobacter gandavensis TaxID=2679963 RepID=UPI00292D491D|nr:DUF2199 domain-containing protein [Pedobacter gandavensis]
MNTLNTFICQSCSEEHHQWPALVFPCPSVYAELSEEEKQYGQTELNDDFCVIERPDGYSFFIRVVLIQKVAGKCDGLEYGVWVSLSESSFLDYNENFNNENHEVRYFGWLSNWMPGYIYSDSVPMNVETKKGNDRPEVIPHQDPEHPFVKDYYAGISLEEAERRVAAVFG